MQRFLCRPERDNPAPIIWEDPAITQPTPLLVQMGKQSPEGGEELIQGQNSVVWRL